jgi:hypothetical protein
MGFFENDPTVNALKAARAAGVTGFRYTIVGRRPYRVVQPGEIRRADFHDEVRKIGERCGLEVVSTGGGVCCLPCHGRGYVDDATARGCVRSSMRCPTCHGRGDFVMEARKEVRPDGWPLCPVCGADELACLQTPQAPEYEWTIAQYLTHELFCYQCGKVTWTPSTAAAPAAELGC